MLKTLVNEACRMKYKLNVATLGEDGRKNIRKIHVLKKCLHTYITHYNSIECLPV